MTEMQNYHRHSSPCTVHHPPCTVHRALRDLKTYFEESVSMCNPKESGYIVTFIIFQISVEARHKPIFSARSVAFLFLL